MKTKNFLTVAFTFMSLLKFSNGRALNPEHDVNIKCTIGVVVAGTSVGGSTGLTIGAIVGSLLFPGLGLKGGLVIGLILGSTIGSGGAGAISQRICEESGVIY